jgi:hypothetical protein
VGTIWYFSQILRLCLDLVFIGGRLFQFEFSNSPSPAHLFAMGMVRAISHVLAALVNNATDFKQRWSQRAPPPAASNGLQGRWQGEWVSEANGHRGALRCLLARGETGDYSATFHAIYAAILRVCYTVPLRGQWGEGRLKLAGDHDLGPLAGGIYHYEGEANEREFICLYSCKYDHGSFRLKPVPQNE